MATELEITKRDFDFASKVYANTSRIAIEDSQFLTFVEFLDETEIQVILAPGHSPGSICFYLPSQGDLIGGDVLFRGSIGRTDLPGGDSETLLTSIREKLWVLPDETVVYSGHGIKTTIGYEKRNNPFL